MGIRKSLTMFGCGGAVATFLIVYLRVNPWIVGMVFATCAAIGIATSKWLDRLDAGSKAVVPNDSESQDKGSTAGHPREL
jgi:hypothetical protein